MKLASRIKFCAFVGLVYIALGDRVLPQNYGNYSMQIRADVNQYLLGLFPTDELGSVKQKRSSFERVEAMKKGSL